MTEWILKALGANVDDVDTISDWSVRWQTEEWGMVVAAMVLVFAILSWWIYRRSPQEVKPGRRALLTFFRVAFLAVLAVLLLQPVLLLRADRSVPRSLPILVDTTASMGIVDADGGSRLKQLEAALSSEKGKQVLNSLDADLNIPVLEFTGDGLEPSERDWSAMKATGDSTALGDTLTKTMDRFRGTPLAGIVVVTDGGQNQGLPISEAGELFRKAGVPIYVVGVGDANARDVAVEGVEVPGVLLADDAAPVSVRLRSQGMTGGSGRVIFSLGGLQVAEEEVAFEKDGVQEIRTLFIPKRTGEYPLEVRFEANGQSEVLSENNQSGASLKVVDRRLKVLLVDQAPRWEYKYLESMLLRERRVDLSCFLFEADREVSQVPGTPYIDRFPSRPEDLFDYDLVILGDIDPRFLPEANQGLLKDYVARAGGALVVVAGKHSMPSFYQRTNLEGLLPVEIAEASVARGTTLASRPVRLNLTSSGESSTMLQLGDDPGTSAALWQRLPPLYWTARVRRAKPGADVLLTRPDPGGSGDSIPVMALHRYGAGEVLFVGTDNFWRWRKNTGDRYHAMLWGQIVQRMAGNRLLTESPRVSLESNQRSYRSGDRVQVYARLFNRNWEPRMDTEVPAVLVSANDPDQRREVFLQAVPGQPGLYRTEFSAGEGGNYRLALSGDEVSTLDFTVRDDQRELSRAAMNEGLLQELASQTGGQFVRLDGLGELPAAITNRTASVTQKSEVDLFASPLVFAFILLLITMEWVLRKFSELK